METQQDDVNDDVKEIKEEIEEDIMIEENETTEKDDFINLKSDVQTGPTIEAKRWTLLICVILIIVILVLAFAFS